MHEKRDTIAFLHDGSFCGFLCATAEVLNLYKASHVIHEACAAGDLSLFDDTVTVVSDAARAETVYRRLAEKTGEESVQRLLEAFCSGFENISRSLSVMAVRLWNEGTRVLGDLADPDALAVEKAAHRTRAEAHLFTGLARFSELSDGSWYAPINPQANILPLIADHFATRCQDMKFVIHDTLRSTAVLHERGSSWYIAADFRLIGGCGSSPSAEIISASEREVRGLWKRYFEAVAIEQRNNPDLQRSRMPKKYWQYLPEKDFGR